MYYGGAEPCPRQMDRGWDCLTIHRVQATTEEERKNPMFCKIHNYVKQSTKDCWTLQRLFHKKLREGTLELT